MESSKFLFVLSVLVAAALATNIEVHDCGSKLAKIDSIDISPCPTIPCPFKKGTQINVTIGFTPNSDVEGAKSSVHGIIQGIPVPFPLKDSDACHTITPQCPLKSGTKAEYRNSVPVLQEYPNIKLVVKWEIVADAGDVMCFTVPVTIVN